ncbi:MAG: hypothetical protein P8186_11580 [Anaerolineae bacterium]|jgi:hypothetical protein
MHLPIPSASLSTLGPWLTLAGFGAYHGLNPAMGWLFALALGLQQNKQRAIWLALLPISAGHAASIGITAALVLALQAFVQMRTLQLLTAGLLMAFGIYKLITWYRHPRWVGMRVRWHELTGWSFLMATAHGAGLMVAPVLLGVVSMSHLSAMSHPAAVDVSLAVGLHTLSMLLTMAVVAWIVYRKLGLMVLRTGWVNFDLIWSVALLVVGGVALVIAL